MKYFSNNLKYLRALKEVGQVEISHDLGYKYPSRYSNYETGKSKPDLETLMLLASYFKVTIDALLYKDLSKKEYKNIDTTNTETVSEPESNYKLSVNSLPLIPTSAIAGYTNGYDNPVLSSDVEYYNIPEFSNKADFLIRVAGSSMYPKYNSGDIVACKILPIDTFFQWNKAYVLDTVQGALVKRIKPGSTTDTLKLVSDNASYPEFEIKISEIRSLALVVGVIRFE